MSTVDMPSALRASANILRSFFSATSLVAVDRDGIQSGERSLLDTHKRLIRKLFVTIREWEALVLPDGTQQAKFEENCRRLNIDQNLESKVFKKANEHPSPPVYGGEIIWLHNERAVISLIQGDLYEAEYSFSRALKANADFKGKRRGHNSDRINVNRSYLMIERGRLREARALLEGLLDDEGFVGRSTQEKHNLDPIIRGYLAMVAHLDGRTDIALDDYNTAIKGLKETEQLRAMGLFQIRRGSLLRKIGQTDAGQKDIEAAIRSAEACRQLDVLWRARLSALSNKSQQYHTDITCQQAIAYGERVGIHRIVVEGLMVQAGSALCAGNLDLAADCCAKAMARATSNGMTLRRISLRILMGRIMMKQSANVSNGKWLISRAIGHADSIGYQAGVQFRRGRQLAR
jgi:tetratricopeptide (TPR) repeat protein